MQLAGYQLKVAQPETRPEMVSRLKRNKTPMLVLDTCQRLECFGPADMDSDLVDLCGQWEHCRAFERLARIAAGLESRILGELEILGQVRDAYKEFRRMANGNSRKLDRTIQDALALARKARRESGIDRNLTSLAALASRELLNRIPSNAPIAVIGSGSIAGSVARYLSKRGSSPVRVTSRCPDRAICLAEEVGGFGGGLDQLIPLLDGVSGIISATAAPHPVLYSHHVDASSRPLTVIDLAEPPDCHTDIQNLDDLGYISLEDIESKALINTAERRKRAEVASRIIRDGALAWSQSR